jgi:hypothetical protein
LPPRTPPGTTLYGLRAVPLVAREAERDALWGALLDVARRGAPRAALITGPSGSGKGRLATWLCELAEELGGVNSLRALPGEGTPALLARNIRCLGLGPAAVEARVQDLLAGEGVADAAESLALAAVLHGARVDHDAARRHLDRLSRRRPIVVWLDEPGPDLVTLVGHILGAPGRVLVVVTARADPGLPAGEPRLPLDPLPPAAIEALVRSLLDLEPALVARAVERAAGNPGAAVTLLDAWTPRLRAGAGGLRLAG